VFRLFMRSFCLLAFLSVAGSALAQTEFSAEIVDHAHSGKQTLSKVYFGKHKMRFDAQDNSDPRGGGAVIFDLTEQSWVVLMPKQHMYMPMSAQSMENRGMFHFFESGNVDNACGDWLKLSGNQGGTCHKVGSETVNGRSTVKYEGTNANGQSSTVWLDSRLRFPVKWDAKDGGGGELQNIQEGAQPASLFEIPPGYAKFDMGAMMQQRNQ
jgi:hypothetical protein